MNLEQNKQVVRLFYEAMNTHDAKRAAATWAAEPINHGKTVSHDAIEKLLESAVMVHENSAIHQMIAEGDWVACRVIVSGKHKTRPPVPLDGGIYQLIEPEGRFFTSQHIHLFRIVDGKIKEHWASRDDLGAARQIGLELTPAIGTAKD